MSNFKDSMGRWFTKSLFFETARTDQKDRVLFTLKEEEHLGYPSLKEMYLDTEDPTEYDFAVEHLGGWNHWKALTKCKWFAPYLADWRDEMEVRVRSRGIKSLISHSLTPKGQTSAKWLAEKGWLDKKRGAPSK
jgi:hypothetical protein